MSDKYIKLGFKLTNFYPMNIIIGSPFFFIQNTTICYKCNANTPVISLAAVSYKAQDADVEELNDLFFFSNIIPIDEKLRNLLKTKFSYFRPFFSKTADQEYWANHCVFCNAAQGDWFLHSEPGEAFFPLEESDWKNYLFIDYRNEQTVEFDGEPSRIKNGNIFQNKAKHIEFGNFPGA
ncbi:hypothetical protein [Sphingobacterium sp. BIGb0116]|uniref:hypothetical protein n=1 Tax=Sphingobacterium sp. BIGb0116 TaxID=2940619 RepID=UPI0021682C62|nr:hypothetical protein [Sphingobacterium sp. BIGb0116]MCS4165212.1 hypothetical protein [Sphingobacterium sp. BIGb0116]